MKKMLTNLLALLGLATACGQQGYENAEVNTFAERIKSPDVVLLDVRTDEEFDERRTAYEFAQPFTKESLLYRELFERHYPGQARMVNGFWMPNRTWEGCDVNDPSARVLANYGKSGD